MARRRMIDPNIWMSEDVSKLDITERLLLIGMFSNADDYGKGRANPAFLRSIVFPYDDIKIDVIKNGIKHIAKYIEIVFYEVDGSQYYKFTNWEKWQTVQKRQDSKIPDPPGPTGNQDRPIPEPVQNDSIPSREQEQNKYRAREVEVKRSEIELKRSKDKTAAYAAQCNDSIPAEKSSTEKKDEGAQSKKTGKDGYTKEFEAFWSKYPRKLEKKAAFKVWKTRLREKTDPADMIQAAVHYADQCQQLETEQRYIKHASTFIGPNEPYQEYVKEIPGAQKRASPGEPKRITRQDYEDAKNSELGW